MSVDQAIEACGDLPNVAKKIEDIARSRPGIPDAGRGNPKSFGRGSPRDSSWQAKWEKASMIRYLYLTNLL